MAGFYKLLQLFESQAGVQVLRMQSGTHPWRISHDGPGSNRETRLHLFEQFVRGGRELRVLVVREFDERIGVIGVTAQFAAALRETRDVRFTQHELLSMVRHRIYSAAGQLRGSEWP